MTSSALTDTPAAFSTRAARLAIGEIISYQLLLGICTIGTVGVGLFTTDPMPLHFPLSMIRTLHAISGASQLVFLLFAALRS